MALAKKMFQEFLSYFGKLDEDTRYNLEDVQAQKATLEQILK